MDDHCFMPQIQKRYAALTAAEKRIADYVQQNPSQTLSLSAAVLAQQADTAASISEALAVSIWATFSPASLVEAAGRKAAHSLKEANLSHSE